MHPACHGASNGYVGDGAATWTGLLNAERDTWKGPCNQCPTSALYVPGNLKACSHSHGEEEVLTRLLANADGVMKRGGTFLEIGGGEGKALSNTYFLESCLGWRGVLVEANPFLAPQLCRNRPHALSFSFGVCPPPTTKMPFVVPKGKLKCFRNKKMGKTICWESHREKKMSAWASGGNPETREYRANLNMEHMNVSCAPLGGLLSTARVTHIDYFSLDVEGAEAVVMQTLDWSRLSMHVVQVEQSKDSIAKNGKVRAMLQTRGFVHVYTHWYWAGHLGDEFFVNGTYLRRNLAAVAKAVKLGGNYIADIAASPESVIERMVRAARSSALYLR